MLRLLGAITAVAMMAACGIAPVADATGAPASSAASDVQVLELSADDGKFSTDLIEAVAGVPIIVSFENRDGIRHYFQLWRDDTRTGGKLFFGDIIDPGRIEYELGPLEAGEYRFECHPHSGTMFGHLVVTEPPPS